jgi:hypothetical protein
VFNACSCTVGIDAVRPHMNKIFRTMQLAPDGAVSFVKSDDRREISVSITMDGVVIISERHSECGDDKAVFGGDKVFLSRFDRESPHGESIILTRNSLESRVYENGRLRSSVVIPVDRTAGILDGFLRAHLIIHQLLKKFHLDRFEEPRTWHDIIPDHLWIPRITGNVSLVGDRGDRISSIGPNKVLLSPLPVEPPLGTYEIGPGVTVKNSDIWYRRFEKMLNCKVYPPNFLRPIGVFEGESRAYIVCLQPHEVESYQLSLPDSLTDTIIDSFLEIVEAVGFLHTIGITPNGCINPHLFLTTSNGELVTNTGYLLSTIIDTRYVFGGFSAEELRFLSPRAIARVSAPVRCVIEALEVSVASPSTPRQDDVYSLGVLLHDMSRPNVLPFPRLSDAEFALSSLLSAAGFTTDTEYLSLLRREDEQSHEDDPVFAKRAEVATPIERLVSRCMSGELGFEELRTSIRQYISWRENQVDSTSVETEVKAVLNKFTSFVHSSHNAVRTAFHTEARHYR